jgi:Nucleotidyl transferase of unknown function (DUF2204)
MEKDHRDLIAEFNGHGVEYVIVGGVAVSAHGIPRYTKDLDLYIRSSKTNSEAVFARWQRTVLPYRERRRQNLPMEKPCCRLASNPTA